MASSLPKMRIIALPITRPPTRLPSAAALNMKRLTYYQVQIPEKARKPKIHEEDAEDARGAGSRRGWLPEGGIADWATQRATLVWSNFGKAEGGWKLKAYQVGQKLIDRTEFEELALKSFDPAMGPSIANISRRKETTSIPLVYPPSQMTPSDALSDLKSYSDFRIARHRKGFYLWMAIIPFTAPLKLIPIIPNFPFFFSAWRAWSHYKAYKSSQYLKGLLDHDLVVPEASKELDEIYSRPSISAFTTHSSTDQSTSHPQQSDSQHSLILGHDDVPKIVSLFDLETESSAANLTRAIDQARLRSLS